MKFNTLFNNTENISFEKYLHKCNIDDIELYLNPVNMVESCELYKNINSAVELLDKYIGGDYVRKLYLLVDCDTDGYSSATMIYLYLKKLRPEIGIEYIIHDGKQHGLANENVMEYLMKQEPGLIIIPDANSPEQYYETLFKGGFEILVCDHHESTESNYATIVNCRFQDTTNHNASGSIVTHQLLRALDSFYGVKFAGEYTDLAMLGCVADVMQMNNYYNRAYFYYGSRLIKNPFLNYLIKQTMEDITPHNISFKIAPLINSVIRYDDYDLKVNLFKAFIGKEDYESVYKQCKKVHTHQKNTVKKISESISNNYEDCKVIIYEANNDMPQSYSGLIAGKLSGNYNKPTLVIRKVDNQYIGSGRSKIPIREKLAESGLFEVCNGHSTAFGVVFDVSNLDKIKKYCKELDLDTDITQDVLMAYNENIKDRKVFSEFYGYDELWGKGIEKPLFGVSNLEINSKLIKEMGSCHIKFNKDGIDYVKFFLTKKEKEKFKVGKGVNLELDIVGTVDLNEFQGNITEQVIIEDYELREKGEPTWQELF